MSLRLRPRQDRGQQVEDWEIEAEPPGSIAAGRDGFGNPWHLLAVWRAHQVLGVVSRARVRTAPPDGPARDSDRRGWDGYRALAPHPDHWDFSGESAFARSSPALTAFADRSGLARPAADPLSDLAGLSAAIHREFEFAPGSTTANSPVEVMLETGRGCARTTRT